MSVVLEGNLDTEQCYLESNGFPNLKQGRQVTRRHRLRVWLAVWMLCADILLIATSFELVSFIYNKIANPPSAILVSTLCIVGYTFSAISLKVYTVTSLEHIPLAVQRSIRALGQTIIISLVVIFLFSVSKEISRFVFFSGSVVFLILLLGHRLIGNRFYRKAYLAAGPDTLIINDDASPLFLSGGVNVDARCEGLNPDPNDPASLDMLARRLSGFERVIIACPPERRRFWAFALQGAHVRGEIVANELLELRATGIDISEGSGRLVVSAPGMRLTNRAIKRLFDLVLSSTALILISPLILVVAIIIKLEDGGPVFFRQQRIGRANRFFYVFKFRSMRTDKLDKTASMLTVRSDPRVTSIGRVIRRMSIDELPQLLNIIRGEMSIVGPRPHALGARAGDALYWEVNQSYWHRHLVKPGLTGLAQVRGFRGPTDVPKDLEQRLSADLEYVRHWSLWRDISIIARTALVVIHPNAF